MPPFLKNNTVFYKTMSKLVPSATPKTTRNVKKLIFTTVENYVFFCYRFFHEIVGKWPPFLEVPGVTFGVILQPFFLLWLPRPHVCKKTRFFIKNDQKVSLKVDPKIVKMTSRRLFCVTEKTLNSASVFFLAFAVSGTPGPSPIVKFPCKYHHFRDATLSQKKHVFLQNNVKTGPLGDP